MPDFDFSEIPADTLTEVCSRSLHTVDGLWFLSVEDKFGFDAAFTPTLIFRLFTDCRSFDVFNASLLIA